MQAFWPLQAFLSVLQPPFPLQEFWPLQACLSASDVPAFLSDVFLPLQPLGPLQEFLSVCDAAGVFVGSGLPCGVGAALAARADPAIKPATAAER